MSLCNEDYVFDNPVWEQMEGGTIPELTGNLRVFKLIGGQMLGMGS